VGDYEPYEWDPRKNAENRAKHGISFEEAKDVFDDPRALDLPDDLHSGEEDRWIALGMLPDGAILLVVYAVRDDHLRLISARPATPSERRSYARQASR